MLKHLIQIAHIIIFSLALLACGNAGIGRGESSTTDSGGGSGGFPSDPIGTGNGSGSGDPDAPAETIGVRIETNSENGLVERKNIPKGDISIIALNYDFDQNHFTSIPYADTQRTENNSYQLEFKELYIEQPNIVIEVIIGQDSQGKNIVLYSPLYTVGLNQSITVNVFSHYVLKKFFDTLEDQDDLEALLPCDTCASNQVLAKANLLAEISKTAQEYAITIPDNLSVAGTMIFLDEQADFRAHIESAVAEVSRDVSPIAKGTRRAYGLESLARLQYSTEYNGLWFALSLNDLQPDNDRNEIIIATETSTIIENTANGSFTYPSYNQFSSFLDTRKEILSSAIPFTRASLAITINGNTNNYQREASSPENFLASLTPNNTVSSTEGFLLNTRALSQQVPKENGEGVGWEFNPIFSKLYKANEYERDTDKSLPIDFEDLPNTSISPTWLIGANYSTGGSFNLTKSGSNFIRGSQIEDLNIFSWEVHGQETKEIFEIEQLNDKTYGVINYSLNLRDGSTNNSDVILDLFAETEEWKIQSSSISFDQPSPHFRSYKRSRNQDNSVNPPINDLILGANTSRTISAVETERNSVSENRGLLKLSGTFSPEGHSTQDGKHLAFVYRNGIGANGQDRGRGITIATELTPTSPTFPDLVIEDGVETGGARYTLSGNTFGINQDVNFLRNINNSTLILSNSSGNNCEASLEGNSVLLEHRVGAGTSSTSNALSSPPPKSSQFINSESCTLNGNQIEISFNASLGTPVDPDNMFNQALTLKGFISPQGTLDSPPTQTPGNVISLLWIQADNLGLVFATKDQQLSPTFDEDA